MNTSHGEPRVICVYKALDDPGLTIMLQLFAALNAVVMFATTLVKLDAVKTRRSTGCGVGVGDGKGVGDADCVGVGEIVYIGVANGVEVKVGVGEAVIVGVEAGKELLLTDNVSLYAK
jgi:hypothetical protein